MSRLNKKHNMKVAAAALAGCILLAGGTGTAYAANVGGIQRTVQVWLHGDQTTANMTVSDDGTYTIEYPDENGETREISGGGIAYEADGTERPLTGEELLEEANSPDVEYNDDGTVLFKSTRVKAHHIGFCGEPDSEWNYRVLASYVRHWGTYPMPLDKVRKQFSSMVEVSYCPQKWTGWSATLAFAMDRGNYLGNSMGAMLTVRKTGGFGK